MCESNKGIVKLFKQKRLLKANKTEKPYRIFTTKHEADLSAWICWNGAVCIIHYRKEGLTEGPHFLY